ncbi:Ig-like domain-containing protein [Microbacterium neimengense]
MRAFEVLARHRAAVASSATLTVAAVAISTLAVLYQGVPTADLELDDGGVWVTKSDDLLVGHLNHPSRLLDGAVRTRAGEFDVLQDGATVLVADTTNATLTAIDPATVALASPVTVPSNASLALGGTTVAVGSGSSLFVSPVSSLAGTVFSEETAAADIGDGAVVAVSSDGAHVFAASATSAVASSAEVAGGVVGALKAVRLTGVSAGDDLEIAAVGDRGVVLDRTSGTLFLPDGSAIAIPDGEQARLQQSGTQTDAVFVATATALIRQPLGGGEPEIVATVDEGTPGAPVWLNGCVYGIWSGSGAYVRACVGDDEVDQRRIDAASSAHLVLRTNRRVVVLNDTTAGTVWVVEQQVEKVENWQDVTPPAEDDADEQESEQEQPQYELPERSAQNNPPTAVDDEYGVRAGRTVLLPVTDNDTDPDGDLLSATPLGGLPNGYTAAPVLGGSAIQVAVPANAQGATSFTYRVDDGRDGTDEATVSLTVRPPDVNAPPEQRRIATVQVEAGASVSYGALDGWIDPDGDDVYLKRASVDTGDSVTYRSNGVVEFTAATGTPGLKEVQLVVSDGREDTEGVLRVNVRPAGSLDPVANSDRVSTVVGVPVTVSPLANDLSPSGQPLRLAKLDSLPGVTIVANYADGTFTFTSDTPDTYYVQYLLSDGPRSAVGLVRIDVLADDGFDQDPIAVRDLALLPTGRDVLVDVLANDSDPGGGVLVVQSARAASGTGIGVEVLTHSVLRVTDVGGLSTPTTISYTISNGTRTATGEVLVLPVALPEVLRPPVAVEDTAVVRAGDVVSVPVLANDYHPDGDTITLLPGLVETDAADPASIFVAGDAVRFQAPSAAGTVHATYEIEDSQRNRSAGYLTIQIVPADAGANSPPRPKSVSARAIAGTEERIAIPLDGIDADGDSVELLGVSSAPAKGRVTAGASWLTYQAYPDASGRDTFTYLVRDQLGAIAEGTVTVGIAPPATENQAPYAAKDVVVVRPDRTVTVAVTANDSDPDGDLITLSETLTVAEGLTATVSHGRVQVTTGSAAGDFTVGYTIADDFGATAQGVLLVTVDPQAPLLPPVARDDRASVLDITDELTVAVPVLENDEDPDGTTAGLEVTLENPDARVSRDGVVTLPVTATAQIVRYTITDPDGGQAQAFIFVPGSAGLLPTLTTTAPLVVDSGEALKISLADHVRVRAGRTPRVATADSIRTAHADGSSALVDEKTLQYTSAAGYFGPDTLALLVTDGTGPDDPDGLTAFLTIPIQVRPSENQPPTLRNASVTVAPGEDAATLELARLAYDPDEGDAAGLRFSVAGQVPAGFRADVSGSKLSVSADADVPAGRSDTLTIEVTDGVTTPTQARVSIRTVTSQRPFAVANDDVIARADQGATQNVDVLANDVNPFVDRGPLVLLSARVDSGRGEADVDGDRVRITPAADFVGTMIVGYRIADATRSADREVEGRVLLTVQGRPAAPGTPIVTSVQDRTVVLSWTAPANNGSPITEYRVSSPQGGSRSCASTTCTIDGLTNDVDYTFTVTAVNEVGESDPSGPSASARPDARPDTPSAPSTVFGDRRITVNWAAPRSAGSPVLSYNLEISPAPATGSIQKTGVTGTSIEWAGLENGIAYQVRVQAVNRAPEPSEWSAYSATVVPAGVPDAPGQPTTAAATPVSGQAQIAVSWAAPANVNGDPIADYALAVKRGGSVLRTIVSTGTTQNVVVDTNETDYTFSVTARNKAGSSASSADSAPRRAAIAPGAPTAVTATPGDGAITVTFTPGPGNGNRASDITYRYRVNQTGAQGVADPGATVIRGLANGGTYSVVVWAESSIEGVATSPEAGSNDAVPFGKPIISFQQVNRQDNAVQFVWSVNPNGRPITSSNAPAAGESNVSWTATGLQPSQEYTLSLTYTNEAGSSTDSRTGKANDPPAPAKNMTISQPNGGTGVTLVMVGFEPNREVSVACWVTPNSDGQGGKTIGSFKVTTNGSGGGSWSWPSTCQMTGGGYGNLRIGNEIWSNTIKLN